MGNIIDLYPDGTESLIFACPDCDSETFSLFFLDDMKIGKYIDWAGIMKIQCANPDCGKECLVFMDSNWEDYYERSDD